MSRGQSETPQSRRSLMPAWGREATNARQRNLLFILLMRQWKTLQSRITAYDSLTGAKASNIAMLKTCIVSTVG